MTKIEKINIALNEACRIFGVSMKTIQSGDRTKRVVTARQYICYVLRKTTIMSLPEIARKINRDHTTVMYALEKFEDRLEKLRGITVDEVDEVRKSIDYISEKMSRVDYEERERFANSLIKLKEYVTTDEMSKFIECAYYQGFISWKIANFLGYPNSIIIDFINKLELREIKDFKTWVSIPNYKNGYIERIKL